jgi:FkbM family methyltransferase
MVTLQRLWLSGLCRVLRGVQAEFKGRWRLERWAVREMRRLGPSLAPTVVHTRDGFRMWADPSEWIGQYVFATGRYEDATVAVMQRTLSPGDAVVDVGANVGYLTLVAARQVGPTGTVTAFEPLPQAREWLIRNVRLNGFENVVVRGEAVCDREGTTALSVGPRHHTSTSSIVQVSAGGQSVAVQCVRLDDVVDGNANLRLLKVDVEGAEHLVLEGGRATLSRQAPTILIELNSQAPIDLLRQLGYEGQTLEGLPLGAFDGQVNAVFLKRR